MINFTLIIAKRNKISGTIQFIEKKNAPQLRGVYFIQIKNYLPSFTFKF